MTTERPAALAERALPILAIVLLVLLLWYLAAFLMNAAAAADRLANAGQDSGLLAILSDTMSQARPLIPAPHQVLRELWNSTMAVPMTSRRSLLFHAWVTASSTLTGFAVGTLLGIALAIAIVHVRTLSSSLMPWIVASQTIPILAIAPIVVVVLGSLGIRGLIPKAAISAYLCFFPVTIGMVKGLTSPDLLLRDLMRTYHASTAQILLKLRWPAALPYLFASLEVAVAAAVVGTIVAELPTGAQAGLGARLLAGSYYGQTVQIWSALVAAAILAALLVGLVRVAGRITTRRMGVSA
jgi:NitT/TauT family transport system permease protein